jgi:autotransporter-associated beta strand protein
MLASAGVAQAQQNVTQATWIGADGQGSSGIWDKWNTAPTAHNYWRSTNLGGQPLVSGARLTNAAALTFVNNGTNLTNDILVDSSIISSSTQMLIFASSGYRLLPGTFPVGIQPTVGNFQDIDLARTLVSAPYTTAPNGTLQLGYVRLDVAGVVGPISAQPFVTLRNPTSFSGGYISAMNANTTINLETLVSSTIGGAFRGNGNINKTGGAVLQYQGFTGRMFSYGTDTRPYSYVQTPFGPALSYSRTDITRYDIRPRDLSSTVGDAADVGRLAGLQGQMRVDGGLLMVSGHLNMWHDFGTTVDANILAPVEIQAQIANIAAGASSADLVYTLAKRMTGVSSVVLNGSSEISFTNTPENVGTGANALRLNFLHNLKAGDANDQFQTTVTTGPDDNYRLGIHIDQGVEGSVGILAGAGKVIKTGAGTLTVLNDSRMSGDFLAAGGRTVLASSTGLTFANSSSFNIAGTQDTGDASAATTTEGAVGLSRRGADIRYQETPNNSGNDPRVDYRPALFPDTGTVTVTTNSLGQYTGVSRSGAEVVLVGDQTVHNFQADFALKSKGTTNVGNATTGEIYTAADAVRTAADVNNKSELVVVGTGYGSNLFLNGSTLTINQDAAGRDGFYNGSVYGADLTTGAAGGRIIKTGGGTLVFLLQSGAYDYTEIQGGTFIANVQGLGQKEVYIGDGGTFSILQNNAGTLSANLTGSAGSTLKLLASATIDNGSGAKIEVNPGRDPGQVDVVNSQEGFYGNIVVNDGVNLSFSGGKNNTFVHANSITLNSGTTRETVLKFGDTSQLVRNLSGDQYSRIELGRGDITLEQNSSDAAFLGSITGVGSLIKQGTAGFTLVGSTGSSVNDSYYGATIVRPGGALVAGSANAIPNSSALVLVGSGSFVTGGQNQILGGLFGSAASTLNLGAATVTVGYTAARAASMASDLAGANPLLADYLGTTDQVNPLLNVTSATATGGAGFTVNVASTAGLAVGQIVKGAGIAPDSIITGVGAGSIILSQALTGTPAGALTATTTTTFTPTSGLSGSTQLTAGSSVGIGVGQAIIGAGIATGSYVTEVVANTSFGVAGGTSGTNIIKTVSSGGLVVGQIVAGNGITNGTRITSITPNTSFVAGVGVVGTRKITTSSTAGLVVGQTVVGTGIPANATITSLTATEVTISANLIAAARGTVAVGALIGLSSNLTSAASGTVNVSALVTLNNALTANLPGQPVNVGTVRSVDVASLNLGAADLNALYNGDIKMSELTRRYLAEVAVGTSIGNYVAPTTDISFAQTLSFDGQLVGTGKLIKSGTEDLTLGGISAGFTGQVEVAQGTLTVNYDSLPNVTALTVDAGASLVVSVADAYNPLTDSIKRTMTTPILGAGNFVKTGAGYLILNPTLSAGQVSYTGTTTVQEGWLQLKALSTNGAAVINNAATLVLTTDADVTYAGAVSGAGQLEVRATNNSTLTAGGSMTHTGGTLVRTGTLLAQTGWAGATNGDIIVESGAKARLNVATNLTATGLFSGAGTIIKEGAAALTLVNATTAFTGTYQSNAGTTVLASANLFGVTSPNVAAIDLRGTSVLDVTADQTFRNLTGEATTTIAYGVDNVVITLPIDNGATNTFAGRFTRGVGVADATIVKTGAGTLNLSPIGANQLTDIVVTQGRLVGTDLGYSGADIFVGANAAVAFDAPTAGATVNFNNNVTGIGGAAGTGSVVKVGAGEAILGAVNLLTDTPDFKVEAGILTLTDSRAGTPAMLIANVSSGATFRVKLAGDRTLGTEISGTGILDLQNDNSLTGAVKVVTVTSQPTVTTTNIGSNVRLDVSGINAVTGITAEAGSFLNIGLIGGSNRTLTLTQSTDGVFNGTLEGTANFTLQGPGLFRYAGDLQATTVGAVTVNGGFLGVNVDNTKLVTLNAVAGTKLGVFVDVGGVSIYNGPLVGVAGTIKFVKTGAGTLNLTSGVVSSLKADLFSSYDIREGTLMATLESDGTILPDSNGDSRTVTLSGGTLSLTVGASGGTLLSGAGTVNTGNLAVTTLAGQNSTLNLSGDVTGNVSVDGGTVLTLGSSSASLLNIAGNLAVTGGSTLTGSANIGGNLSVDANSFLAPGYSPGTQNVTGNFTLAGTAIMEVSGDSVSGQYNDVVNFSGTADLNLGGASTLRISRWNNGSSTVAPAFGQRFVLFKGTATPSTGATLVSSYFVNATPGSVVTDDLTGRYLVVAPADGALSNTTVPGADGLIHNPNEYAVYAVRAPSGYVVDGLDAGILSYVQAATNVAPGTVVTTVTDPLAGRLMTMTDAQLAPALLSLQPESLGSIAGSVVLGQRAEADALQRRLDMRRYDRAGYSVYSSEWFALATSSSFKGGSGSGAAPFDTTVTGGLAGLVKDLNPWSVAGFSAGYSRTKSDLRAGGAAAGSVSGNAYRLTGFFSSMLGDRKDSLFVDAGISAGTSTSKSSRTTFLGTQNADPKATSYGGFARFGAGYATKAGVSFSPFVGVDFAKVSASGFSETGDSTALNVHSYSYTSARATLGTGMTWLSVGDGETLKFTVDFEAFTELGGGKSTDIVAELNGTSFTSHANVSAGNGFRLAPSFTYGPTPDSAVYFTLSLEKAGATKTTGIEAGYRRRF